MIIDPKKRRQERVAEGKSADPELGEGGTTRIRTECRVPAAVVGWEHYRSSAKGTPGLLVRFVALEGPEAGAVTETTFWLTDAAISRLADLIVALGNTEPVDVTDDDALEAAFSRGAVMMEVKGRTYTVNGQERTTYEAAWFGRYEGKGSKAWNEHVAQATEGWTRYVQWRQRNPRPEPGSGGTSSGSGGHGGAGGYHDDTIPF